MDQLRAAGRDLAERHHQRAGAATGPTLLDYAELPRDGEWSLRSALVRVAQRDPLRAAAVLEAVRRCDAALHPLRRSLERRLVAPEPIPGSPGPAPDTATPGRATPEPIPGSGTATPDPATPDTATPDTAVPDRAGAGTGGDAGPDGPAGGFAVPEPRVVGLGRLQVAAAQRGDDPDQVVAGYREVADLDDGEIQALPLVPAVLLLDELAALAARWAVTATDPVPTAELDRLCGAAWAALDRAGAPLEQGPPPGARSRRG